MADRAGPVDRRPGPHELAVGRRQAQLRPDPRGLDSRARHGHTVVAEEAGGLIAFAHTDFEDDPTWGALAAIRMG
jgi:hypothetical protein